MIHAPFTERESDFASLRLMIRKVLTALEAQGIETGTAATAGRGPEDESPVAESDAPKRNSHD